MKIGILGTGVVGQTLGEKLVSRGHEVRLGSRSGSGGSGAEWTAKVGAKGSLGTFADAAAFGELLFLCTKGEVALEVVRLAGAEALGAKVLIDVSNPLDFSRGFPPALTIQGFDSLGERIQAAAPNARVVKALNTVAAPVMIDPAKVPGEHDLFLCGNDDAAKGEVKALLADAFGWKNFVDVGGIEASRGTEALLPLWTRLYGRFGSPLFNFHIARSE
jgi:8-hydroxy-5-deazaflavin:NADPH oxidoreductase